MRKLKPCPFCGDTYIKTYRSRAGYRVGCNTVNCIACHEYVRSHKTEKEAIEAWNRRVSDDCLNEHNGNVYGTKEYSEGCVRCKLAWLDREYDTYPSDDDIWERTEE